MADKVLTLENIRKGNKAGKIDWEYTNVNKDGAEYPLKVWQNLKCVLDKHNITVKYNEITKEEEITGMRFDGANAQLTEIVGIQTIDGLRMSKELVNDSLTRIAVENSYNPFLEMLEEYENDNPELIKKVFDCIKINPEYIKNYDYYSSIFLKWVISVVHMANNSLDKNYNSHGILVLQGGQGCFKSTFARKLMPEVKWFKGDKSLDPNSTDSISQNTKYILVEWGELDSTLKGEQAKLKQFITSTSDEYRKPYQSKSEKYPRITSYIGTVNKKDFLKDETGSRRFWIIPVDKCDIAALDEIDMREFWGAVYHLYKQDTIKPYLEQEELAVLAELNSEFNYQTDISIILDERLDWSMSEDFWTVYNISEISELLYIKEKKALKLELEKRGIEYKSYRVKDRTKKGFRIPTIDKYNI